MQPAGGDDCKSPTGYEGCGVVCHAWGLQVIGAGTGGTVCGIGRKFKEISPRTKIVAADPQGSVLALPDALNQTDVAFYEVEGIGKSRKLLSR